MKDHENPHKNDHSSAEDQPKTGKSSTPPNPPRTTTGKFTSPKFGSAGSGGAELEPGSEKD